MNTAFQTIGKAMIKWDKIGMLYLQRFNVSAQLSFDLSERVILLVTHGVTGRVIKLRYIRPFRMAICMFL